MYETYDGEILTARRGIAHPRLGAVGGGQLAKMTALAALQLGCEVVVGELIKYRSNRLCMLPCARCKSW